MTAARMAIAAFVQGPHPLSLLAQIFRAAMGRITDPYRPEKHYMRGPGPKCRAKSSEALAAAQLRA